MRQTLFETRQRAEELLREAVAIWRKSDQSEYLEGIEKDPVFSLLMTALAYQANEMESDIERLKNEVLDDFARMLIPYELGHAVPATAVVETAPLGNVSEVRLDARSSFVLNGSGYRFMPLLHTRVVGGRVSSVVRLDARRWKVSLAFKKPISDLSELSFAITSSGFQDLKVTLNGQPLPLVKPWDYSNLPLCKSFVLDTMLYNRSQAYHAPTACLDLFARQDVRLFCISRHNPHKFIPVEADKLDLVFEFTGIASDFLFDKSVLALNTVLLVNAEFHSVNLSSANPIVRVAGYGSDLSSKGEDGKQFLQLVRPSEDQLYGDAAVDVRYVAADRFNRGSLVRLLNSLINKFSSDFYAFQQFKELYNDNVIQHLQDILSRLMEVGIQSPAGSIAGVYLMLRRSEISRKSDLNMEISYLTTDGAFVNSQLNQRSTFGVPSGLDGMATRQVATPVPGSNEIQDRDAQHSLAGYYLITNDRIVTPADMKMFCYNELMVRYGIISDMIENVSVSHRQQIDRQHCGYEILVEIVLANNPFVKRSFVDKIPQAELKLQKMMEVRSTNIYPIQVNIRVES